MSTRLTCPGCGRILLLPVDCTAETLSCPRCLVVIPNPQAVPASSGVQTTLPPAPPPTPASTEITERRPWMHSADVDVRRDSNSMSVLGNILGVLVALGIFAAIFSRSFRVLIFVLVGVLVVVFAAWVNMLQSMSRGRDTVSQMTFPLLTILLGFVGLVVAGVIYLYAVCS